MKIVLGLTVFFTQLPLHASAGDGYAEGPREYVIETLDELAKLSERSLRRYKVGDYEQTPPQERHLFNRYIVQEYFADQPEDSTTAYQDRRWSLVRKYKVLDSVGPYVDVRIWKKGCRKNRRNHCYDLRFKVASSDSGYALVPGQTVTGVGYVSLHWRYHYWDDRPLPEFTPAEHAEKVGPVKKNVHGQWPWLANELAMFRETNKSVPLKRPADIDREILCWLSSDQFEYISHEKFITKFSPYLSRLAFERPEILPGKIRVLEHYIWSSKFRDTLFRYSNMPDIRHLKRLDELRRKLPEETFPVLVERYEPTYRYYIVGFPIGFDSSGEITRYAESLHGRHKYFSVIARIKFAKGKLVQNTMNSDLGVECGGMPTPAS